MINSMLMQFTIAKPLTVCVLGRAVRKIEMRTQLATLCVLVVGSFAGYLADHLYEDT